MTLQSLETSQKLGNRFFHEFLVTNVISAGEWKTKFQNKPALIVRPCYFINEEINQYNLFAKYLVDIRNRYNLHYIVIDHSSEGITYATLQFLYKYLLPLCVHQYNLKSENIYVLFGAEPTYLNALDYANTSKKFFNQVHE